MKSKIQKLTVPDIIKMKNKKIITMLTAYDYSMAEILDKAGVDIILVGDSYAMTELGMPNTLAVEMEDMITITAAVSKAVKRALVVADMPFLSYQTNIKTARTNAGLFIKKANADAVKMETGPDTIDLVKGVIDIDIPVMGHIGLTPQSVKKMGGFRIQGKTVKSAYTLIKQAKELEKAGVFSIVLEGIPAELSKIITDEVSVPTIGIGAGPFCDGQVQVIHDLLGLSLSPVPKHAKSYANLSKVILKSVKSFNEDVKKRFFPKKSQYITMDKIEYKNLLNRLKNENNKRSCQDSESSVKIF